MKLANIDCGTCIIHHTLDLANQEHSFWIIVLHSFTKFLPMVNVLLLLEGWRDLVIVGKVHTLLMFPPQVDLPPYSQRKDALRIVHTEAKENRRYKDRGKLHSFLFNHKGIWPTKIETCVQGLC